MTQMNQAAPIKPPSSAADDSGMPTEANPANAYLRTRVMTAAPEELRLILLDAAIRFAQQGREGIEKRDYEAIYEGIRQSREIVLELLTSIDNAEQSEVTERIRSVYMFLYKELLTLGIERDLPRLDKVIEILEYERETWVLLMEKVAKERAGGSSTPTAPANDLGERPSLSIQA